MKKIDPKIFVDDIFLLHNKTAQKLYHDFAKVLPIIDYHSHLDPTILAENKPFRNLTTLWLSGDHYKWRAMRTLGVTEKFITGQASDEEKFFAWANCIPQTLRNPLFHWTQLELKRTFGITAFLNADTAQDIYTKCNQLLQDKKYLPQSFLKNDNVELLGTTDDPCDDLLHHQFLAQQQKDTHVIPSFRPDKIFQIDQREAFILYVNKLSVTSQIQITDIDSLLQALHKRVDYFHANGCRIADHGLTQMPRKENFTSALEQEFKTFLNQKENTFSNPSAFQYFVLHTLAKLYHQKKWVQQFHLGPIRNNNSRLLQQLGADCGVDSIGDGQHIHHLSVFLNDLDKTNQLAKTILYNINPADNEAFASMTGNFNDGTTKGKIQFGAAWWFMDQKEGIEKHLNALSSISIISTFVGMTTDSRSFLSFSRHEYFRRILCNLFGKEMEEGVLPYDMAWIGQILQQICYHNAKNYFLNDKP